MKDVIMISREQLKYIYNIFQQPFYVTSVITLATFSKQFGYNVYFKLMVSHQNYSDYIKIYLEVETENGIQQSRGFVFLPCDNLSFKEIGDYLSYLLATKEIKADLTKILKQHFPDKLDKILLMTYKNGINNGKVVKRR